MFSGIAPGTRKIDDKRQSPAAKKAAIVHLVHGTFARQADWTQPESPLARELVQTLGQHTLIEPFEWTGANSHAARQIAGSQLAAKLQDFHVRHPGRPQFVVAHSHGGNVAAYALGVSDVRSTVRGVACLGTPFIRVVGRDLGDARRLVRWLLAACLLAIVLYAIALIAFSIGLAVQPERLMELETADPALYADLIDSPFFPYGFVATTLLLGGGIGWLLSRPVVGLWRFANARALPVLAQMQADTVDRLRARFGDTPLLIVNARGDEAAWWLAWISRFAGLPYRIWRPSRFLLLGTLALCALGVVVLQSRVSLDFEGASLLYFWVLVTLIWFIVAIGIVAAAGWLACLIWPALFRGHALGFGGDDVFKNFLVEISASRVPEHSVDVHEHVVRTSGKGLRHSRLHEEAAVVRIVSDWLARLE